MIGNYHEIDLIRLLETRVAVINNLSDLWTKVRDWFLRPVCRLRAASEQIWRTSLKKTD